MKETIEINAKPQINISEEIETLGSDLLQTYREYKNKIINKIEINCDQFNIEDLENIEISIYIKSIANILQIEISSELLGLFNCEELFGNGNLSEDSTKFIFEKKLNVSHEEKISFSQDEISFKKVNCFIEDNVTHNYPENKSLIEFISRLKKVIKLVSNQVTLFQGNKLKFENFDENSHQLTIQGDKTNQGLLQKAFGNLVLDDSISKFSCDENFKFIITGPFRQREKIESVTTNHFTNNENTEYASCYSSFWTEEKTASNLSLLSLAKSYNIASKADDKNYFFKGADIEEFCSRLLDLHIPVDFVEDGVIKISSSIIEEYEQLHSDTDGKNSTFF